MQSPYSCELPCRQKMTEIDLSMIRERLKIGVKKSLSKDESWSFTKDMRAKFDLLFIHESHSPLLV